MKKLINVKLTSKAEVKQMLCQSQISIRETKTVNSLFFIHVFFEMIDSFKSSTP